jgi:hypothetical protein
VLIATAGIAVVGQLPRDVAEQLLGEPRAVVAGTLMPTGRAVAVESGYRVSGRWAFASGIRHANWVFATSIVMDGDDWVAASLEEVLPVGMDLRGKFVSASTALMLVIDRSAPIHCAVVSDAAINDGCT